MMHQQEIPFFWPLTEQVNLDLDYTPCERYQEEQRKQWAASSITLTSGTGLTLAANGAVTWATVSPNYQDFQVLPDGAVGSWKVTPNMSVGRKTKPNFLHRIFTKLILGWEWKDNIIKGK